MRAFLLLITLFFTTSVFSQKIDFYNDIQPALDKARQLNKPMFVMVGPEVFISVKRFGTNIKFAPGINKKEVAKLYNSKFVNARINISDKSYPAFLKFFPNKINIYPAYLFFDSNGNLIYNGEPIIATDAKPYLDMASNALKAMPSKTVAYYEALRSQGKLNKAGYKQYIALRQQLGLYDNAILADEYAAMLTPNELQDIDELFFIVKAGPIFNSKTFMLCYTNRKFSDSVYKIKPVALRIALNKHIIDNTRAEAIRKRNVILATKLSEFCRVVYSYPSNFELGAKVRTYEMLTYYSAVRDTANYYRQSIGYFDRYYMRLTADSINKLREESLEESKVAGMEKMKQLHLNMRVNPGNANNNNNNNSGKATSIVRTRELVAIPSAAVKTDVPGILNNAAYDFYTLGTHNPAYLTKALLWCKRAIALSPDNHAYYDTMAHLLYRLDFYDEAIVNQTKAIKLARKDGSMDDSYMAHLKNELNKMQQRAL